MYHHTLPDTDLVVIISGSQVFVRDVRTVFLVGQLCPKVEVPPPNSKSAMQFQKDFLLVSGEEGRQVVLQSSPLCVCAAVPVQVVS